MIVGGEIFLIYRKYTEGVALSGMEDLNRTDLWRDLKWRRRGKRLKSL
jgi:hypothetical protein